MVYRILNKPINRQEQGDSMTSTEMLSILEAAQKLFGLTNAELEKRASDPEQLLIIADIVEASQ